MVDEIREWNTVAVNDNGTKIAVGVWGNPIYISDDSGTTWTERSTAGSRNWHSIAMSGDGMKLAAIGRYGISNNSEYIHTSIDGGVTWTERTGAGSHDWASITSSSDGTKLAAADVNNWNGGYIYTSTDSGATWTERTSAGSRDWASVVSSADGTRLIAGVDIGSLYLSTDSGATWLPFSDLNSVGGWYNLAMTPDGTTLFAADSYGTDGNGGHAYVSRDGGSTWQEQTGLGLRYWSGWYGTGAAISADGQTIAITDVYGSDWNDWNGGYIYITRDGGAHWQAQVAAGTREWTGIDMSSDGSRIVAVASRGRVYLATLQPPATTTKNLTTLPSDRNIASNQAINRAVLSATSETCYTFDEPTIRTLNTQGITPPDPTINLLGGIAFNLTCTSSGGTSDIDLTLGTTYTDTSKLRAYKTTGTTLTDITDHVTFTNTDIDGVTKTVLSYTLTDGGELDEDATTNGTIVDPIYIGLATTPTVPNTGQLLVTFTNPIALLIATSATTGLGLATFVRKRKAGSIG